MNYLHHTWMSALVTPELGTRERAISHQGAAKNFYFHISAVVEISANKSFFALFAAIEYISPELGVRRVA